MRTLASVTAIAVAGAAIAAAQERAPLHETYRDTAGKIIGAALTSDHAYDRLGVLCDRFGHRLSGSPQLEEAIDWAAEQMREDGFSAVHEEEVMVPAWVRGREHAELIAPRRARINMLGLGDSVGTGPGGIEAEVVVVGSFAEVDNLGEAGISGKIVLYDVPFTTYGETVKYRGKGASHAAKHGAVAALVRSVGPLSFDTPHTGALRYAKDAPKIPAAAITIEAAAMLRRMAERGTTMRMRLEMGAHQLEDQPSANLVADFPGSERPEEIVLLAGHFDSWDVGQGAQDDGAGCLIAWEAARLIKELGLQPKRTIRVVLFTNEENGLRGGKDYAKRHAAAMRLHVAAIESDSGNGLASGFRFQVPPFAESTDKTEKKRAEPFEGQLRRRGMALLAEMAPLLAPLRSTEMVAGGAGADVGPSVKKGVAGLGLDHDTTEYFLIHHTRADTFEKIDKLDLNTNVASMAVMAYILADMPDRLIDPDELERLRREFLSERVETPNQPPLER